jgi:hypothetical protein
MTLWQHWKLRWKHTAFHNQAMVITSVMVAFGTLFYTGAAIFQLLMVNLSDTHTNEQIGRIIDNENWMARSIDQSVKDLESNNKQVAQNAEESIKATQEQMLLDQRAWVGFSDVTTQYGAGSQVAGSVIVNNGRTPARNIHTIIMFGDMSRTGELNTSDELWMRKVISAARKTPFGRNENLTNDPQGVGDHGGFKFIYEPNLVPRDVAGGIIHAPMAITVGTLAPGEQYPLMGIGKPLDGGSEWSAESGQKSALVVFGFIGYKDIFNRPHVTTFCNERFAGLVDLFGRCPFYNNMN